MNHHLNVTHFDLTLPHPELIDVVRQVAAGKPMIFRQNGKNVAAMISIEDLHLLERLIEEEEDRIDIAQSKEILVEVKEQGTVPWENIKAKLGL
jgi:hypothetical protein